MSLLSQNVTIVPTPSGICDGHFPDGNDGTAGIPLTWAVIPSFLQKQVGTPFSVDLFTGYLTQPGGATASVTPGFSLVGGSGWTLNGAGVLSYSGAGQGTGTIKVRATLGGNTSDSNFFTYESIATIVSADTLPPTVPTNPAMVSKTATQVVVNSDVPSDVPTSLIPSSGLKEVRWFKNGVIDGVTSYPLGLQLRLSKVDVATAIGARKLALGHYTVFLSGQTSSGIQNPTHVWDTGPITAGTSGLVVRYKWTDMELSSGVYDFSDQRRDIKTCSNAGQVNGGGSSMNNGVGPYLFGMIIQKTFGGLITVACNECAGTNTCTLTASVTNGTYGALFDQVVGTVHTDVLRLPVTVTGGTTVTWSGNLPSGGGISIKGADFVATSSSPLPDYMLQQSIPYHGNIGNGWVAKRWDPTYLNRFDALMKALGQADPQDPNYPNIHSFDAHPNWGGVATQETANNGAEIDPGYTQPNYAFGLKAESDSISKWMPTSRHLWYMNFMSGNTTQATANLKDVAGHIWQNGAIVAGPDLVTSGTIVNPRCYPVYQAYHDGNASAEQLGQGYTACSVQPAEWTGQNPNGTPFAPADGLRKMADLFAYGQIYTANTPTADSLGRAWTVPSHLQLDIMLWNWQTGANDLGENFSNAAAPLCRTKTAPIGTLGFPSGGLTPGVVTQTANDYTVLSYGTGLSATTDQFTAASNSVNGNITVICKFNGMTGTDLTSSPVMGIRIGDSSGSQSKAVYMVATSSQLRSRYRITAGSSPTDLVNVGSQGWNVPKYVKINRTVDAWTFFYSADTLVWTAMGSVTLAMNQTIYIQLFAATTGTSSVTATFQQVNIQQVAKINYSFNGLTTLTSYNFTAVGRDLANNDSAASATLTVVTS